MARRLTNQALRKEEALRTNTDDWAPARFQSNLVYNSSNDLESKIVKKTNMHNDNKHGDAMMSTYDATFNSNTHAKNERNEQVNSGNYNKNVKFYNDGYIHNKKNPVESGWEERTLKEKKTNKVVDYRKTNKDTQVAHSRNKEERLKTQMSSMVSENDRFNHEKHNQVANANPNTNTHYSETIVNKIKEKEGAFVRVDDLQDEEQWRKRTNQELMHELAIDPMNPPKGYMSGLSFNELNPKFYKHVPPVYTNRIPCAGRMLQ